MWPDSDSEFLTVTLEPEQGQFPLGLNLDNEKFDEETFLTNVVDQFCPLFPDFHGHGQNSKWSEIHLQLNKPVNSWFKSQFLLPLWVFSLPQWGKCC